MKNLFDRATRRIYEAFNGPKVVDNEFDEKVKEMEKSERGLVMLREVFVNAENNFSGLRCHFTSVYSSIKNIYEGNPAYEIISNEIVHVHIDMEEICKNFLKSLNDVKSMTDEWTGLFSDARMAINKRIEDRREYEHYDEKMEDIMKERAQKTSETSKDIEYYNRVRNILINIYIYIKYIVFFFRMKLNSKMPQKNT